MSYLTVEVVTGPAKEDAPDNRQLIKGLSADLLKQHDGMPKCFYGLDAETETTAYLVTVFADSSEVDSRDLQAVVYDTPSAAKRQIIRVKVTSANDLYNALGAPFTEVATLTLSDIKSKGDLEDILDDLKETFQAVTSKPDSPVTGKPDFINASWGQTVEETVLVGFFGWDSVEAHYKSVQESSKATDLIKRAKQLATIEVYHVPFSDEVA